ncbi:MAG: hypothetical protein Q4B78_03715, partial [Bacillota bacterium]|nr:hypothetical protein [Bacillota bacterium]
MKISREIDGKPVEIDLTQEELVEASVELRRMFYQDVLDEYYEYSNDEKNAIIALANSIYLKTEDPTEYEALEDAIQI